jgi:hypothetical protein
MVAAATIVTLIVACSGSGESKPEPAVRDTSAVARPDPVAVMPLQLESLPPRADANVTAVRVRRDTTTFSVGPAVVSLGNGDSVVVSDSAFRAWRLSGSLVAFSGLDGAGGYENEGQSLTVVNLATGARRRVVADYFQIVRVELGEAGGKRALLVHMRDGGQGSLHVTVVDPVRGQVFRRLNARGRVAGAMMIVNGYGDGETPVTFDDTRVPLRIDTVRVAATDTMALLVIPRAARR